MNPPPPFLGVTCGLRTESQGRRTTELFLARRYLNAVTDAGGVGLPLPILPPQIDVSVLLSRVDGVLLTGGADIPPDYYGQPLHPHTKQLLRDRVDFELRLVRAAVAADKPILGICYGHQLLNVALGGALYQHLEEEVGTTIQHQPSGEARAARHSVTVHGGKLARILQDGVHEVPSSHHQAVSQVAPGCEVTAVAPDGIIEAIELPGRSFVIGVQWHPELDRQDAWTRRLMDAFVEACSG